MSTPRLSPSTRQTLDLLRGQPGPVDLATLSGLTGLHPNSLREHLDTLAGAGLVSRTRAAPHGRGRPAWLYGARAVMTAESEYAGLAATLAEAILRTSPDPGAVAEQAGESWGRDLARQRGAGPTTPEAARELAVGLLDDLGFAPVQEGPSDAHVRLTRCPLLDAARENPRVVCAVHLGMVRGVLDECGVDPAGSGLVPFAEPGSCLLTIPPVPPPPP